MWDNCCCVHKISEIFHFVVYTDVVISLDLHFLRNLFGRCWIWCCVFVYKRWKIKQRKTKMNWLINWKWNCSHRNILIEESMISDFYLFINTFLCLVWVSNEVFRHLFKLNDLLHHVMLYEDLNTRGICHILWSFFSSFLYIHFVNMRSSNISKRIYGLETVSLSKTYHVFVQNI